MKSDGASWRVMVPHNMRMTYFGIFVILSLPNTDMFIV